MKIIAFYLPQFYSFPENDEWWGKGFTEWTNVKKAKPLYKDHYQPTIPLNKYFYSLEDVETMRWQASLAKKYGIYGFCFYHYWFGEGRQLMEKPVENYLSCSSIDFPFCICWANHNWSRTWVGGDKDILMDVRYGDEDEWEKHFQYLLPYFKDNRYIKVDGKSVLVIYQPQLIPCYDEMIIYFQRRAKEEGLDGLSILAQAMFEDGDKKMESLIDYKIQYEPNYSRTMAWNHFFSTFKIVPSFALDLVLYKAKGVIKKISKGKLCHYRNYSYDAIWKYIIKSKVANEKMIAGAFVKCDVTPRRQDRALIYKGDSPLKFKNYMSALINKVNKQYKQKIIFLSAWNEWGEGMYLEPDEKNEYRYLKAIRAAMKEVN